MRVYFNLANSAGSIPDSDGIDVIDLDDAYAQAKQAITEILQENEPMKADMAGWRLDAVRIHRSGSLLDRLRQCDPMNSLQSAACHVVF